MKKVILFLMLFLVAIWVSEIMAQHPIYDPFFEMFKSTVKAGRRELTSDGQLLFKDYQHVLPSYRLTIFLFIYPAYPVPEIGIESITVSAWIDDRADYQMFSIIAHGTGIGKTWMERKWEYEIFKVPSDSGITTVSENVAKEAAKKFLDLWHGRISIEPKDIPKIFH